MSLSLSFIVYFPVPWFYYLLLFSPFANFTFWNILNISDLWLFSLSSRLSLQLPVVLILKFLLFVIVPLIFWRWVLLLFVPVFHGGVFPEPQAIFNHLFIFVFENLYFPVTGGYSNNQRLSAWHGRVWEGESCSLWVLPIAYLLVV